MTHEITPNDDVLEYWPRSETNSAWVERLKKLGHIEVALKEGSKAHAFLSGGGLRVIRVEKDDHLVGYGESPYVEDALVLADIDLEYGGRDYGNVYGDGKEYPNFITGSSSPSGELDAWLRKGHTFNAWSENENLVVELRGYERVDFPKDLLERVIARGIPAGWRSERGFVYAINPVIFANGETGTRIKVIRSVKGKDSFMYPVSKVGKGDSFNVALQKALQAPSVEIEENA